MKSTMTTAPLGALTASPLNVRKVQHSAAKIGEIAASIEAKGLIQPIVVHTVAKASRGKPAKLGVIAGQGRWNALLQMQGEGVTFDYEAVPVNHVEGTDAELTGISFDENYARQNMRPHEIYAAFRTMKEQNPDYDEETFAAQYNLTAAEIARTMRLAFLHPTVFAAYAAGDLKDEQAFAYAATADQTLQLQTFEALSQQQEYQRHPNNIRAAMKVGAREAQSLLLFVGLDLYEEAGGVFEVDLFAQSAGSGIVRDEELLRRLANEALEQLKQDTIAEHAATGTVTFVEEAPTDKYGSSYEFRVYPKPGNPTPEQQERLEAIAVRQEEIEVELDANAETWFDSEGDPVAEHAAAIDALEDENSALLDEERAIRATLPTGMPEGEKVATITIGGDGKPNIAFFWPGKKPKAAGGGIIPGAKPDLPEKVGYTLKQIRANMFAAHVFETFPAAEATRALVHDALIFSIYRELVSPSRDTYYYAADSTLGLTQSFAGGFYTNMGSEPPFETDLSDVPGLGTDDAIAGLSSFHHDATPAQKDRVAAFIYVRKVQGELYTPGRRSIPEWIAIGMARPGLARRAWNPNAAFFGLFKKDRILGWLGAIDQQFRADFSKHKATELKVNAAAFFEASDEAATRFGIGSARTGIRAWLPEWLHWNEYVPLDPPQAAKAEDASDDDDADDQFANGEPLDDAGEFEEAAE